MRWAGVTIEIPAVWAPERDRWESPDGAYYFDTEAADNAQDFFPSLLVHHIGEFAGEPFVLRDDQAQLMVRPIFGWKRSSDGLRRFRKLFAFCPKGYGKSPLSAGLGIYLARCDGEAAAEVYALAADRENARIVHDNAKIMIENSPLLHEGCEITKNAIVWAEIHSTYKVLSADATTAHGLRPSAAIFDEMHAQKNRDLYEAIKKSMVKRRQPLMIIITHAGTDDEGICYEEYEYAKAVLQGQSHDDACLPVIFEAQPDEDWASPATWQRVNPGHGVTVKHDGVLNECVEAQNEPRKRNDFLRYHLNRWTNQAVAWLPIDWWDACDEPMPSDAELALLPCAAGLDLAQKIDLAALVLVFRQKIPDTIAVEVVGTGADGKESVATYNLNYKVIVKSYFWIPELTMREHEKNDRVPYSHWADLGIVTPTEGASIDYSRIYRDIAEKILPAFPKLREGSIGYDPAFASDLAQNLDKLAGRSWCVEVLGNYKYLSEPSHVLEALIKARRVIHGQHRVLRNHIGNVAVKRDDAGRIRPVKPKKASKHIDGVVALLFALRELQLAPDEGLEYFVEL